MDTFNTNLERANSICYGYTKYLDDYSKIFPFTTENIDGYIDYFDLVNKSLLTIGSSGDQLLNAFLKGTNDITLYDINPYAKYYVYLKIAGILCLEYNEFEEFFFKHGLGIYDNENRFSINTFNKLKNTLKSIDYESYYFFNDLFNKYGSYNVSEYLFFNEENRNKIIKKFNTYLKDEISYNKLKKIINNINFKYVNGDIFKDKVEGKYDNIFLSNLCTITTLKQLKELLIKLDNNLSTNGSMLIGYLWNTYYEKNDYQKNYKEVYKMPLTREILKDYITEYHNITSDTDILFERNNKDDLVLIYRKH